MLNSFARLKFPIFYVGKNKPEVEGDKIYTQHIVESDEGDTLVKLLIDDKSIEKDSLALRRLKLKSSGVELFKLKYAIFYIADMLKMCKGPTWFIDSTGELFEYRKSKRVPLIFRPIERIMPINSGGAIIEVHGISTRFKVLHAPRNNEKYAGLLLVGVGYILYGLYQEQLEDGYRVI